MLIGVGTRIILQYELLLESLFCSTFFMSQDQESKSLIKGISSDPKVIPLIFKFYLTIFYMFNQQEVNPYILPLLKTGRLPAFFFYRLSG